jgi:hypothetical protein
MEKRMNKLELIQFIVSVGGFIFSFWSLGDFENVWSSSGSSFFVWTNTGPSEAMFRGEPSNVSGFVKSTADHWLIG